MKEPDNDQQRLFFDEYIRTRSVAEACENAGYTSVASCYNLLRKYKDYVLDLMAHELILAGPEAIHKLKGMLGDGATEVGATTRLDAAKQILDRIGIIKKEKVEIETSQGGIFILPPKSKD